MMRVVILMTKTTNEELQYQHKKAVNCLRACGGQIQLFVLLTGPTGAGKSTAVKPVEQFCIKHSRYINKIRR